MHILLGTFLRSPSAAFISCRVGALCVSGVMCAVKLCGGATCWLLMECNSTCHFFIPQVERFVQDEVNPSLLPYHDLLKGKLDLLV